MVYHHGNDRVVVEHRVSDHVVVGRHVNGRVVVVLVDHDHDMVGHCVSDRGLYCEL